MDERATLRFDIRAYWHAGTGAGQGAVLDMVVHRDRNGLPRLPGRTVRGLVRDAVSHAEALGWVEKEITRQMFGDGDGNPGSLRFGDGQLPPEDRAALSHPEAEALKASLYRALYSTAVDSESGAAKPRSLRSMEVVVPLVLHAPVMVVPGASPPKDWTETLIPALPLLRAVGKQRTRGLGRAVVTLEEWVDDAV